MFVGVGASVHPDTKILIKHKNSTKLLPIGEFIDQFYQDDQEGFTVPVVGAQTIGVDFARGNKFFGSSAWKKIGAVYRHRVNKIYEIKFTGGNIAVTADHSVFVREKNYIVSKRTDELKVGDTLVSLPYKTRSLFIPGVGTTHKIKSHPFPTRLPYNRLPVWISEPVKNGVLEYRFVPRSVAHAFQSAGLVTRSVSSPVTAVIANTTDTLTYSVPITRDLCKLLGYYAAEGWHHGRAVKFGFAIYERELHRDCVDLMRRVFNINPHFSPTKNNAMQIEFYSVPLTRFFASHCGEGAHNKHVPEFMWDMPREYFISYLDGLVEGDGHIGKKGLIELTSCSTQLISELSWLLHMHGMPCSVTKYEQDGGRYIKNSKSPLPDTTHYRITIGKSANHLTGDLETDFGRKTTIKEIVEKPYDGYVYDLCGVDNEAFFGGEKPVLLHNSRVRDLFTKAKKTAPTVIFIDELDAVGRQRGTGLGGSHDEREQTLNQILVEMDGFDTEANVVVLAATNRADVLDPALLRPGRFDRKVVLDMPDRPERAEILAIHSKNKPLGKDVNLEEVAKSTPGLSGADLRNVANEAAILAARDNRKKLEQKDFRNSIEKVLLGPERTSHLMKDKEKEIVAYHEAGHAIVGHLLADADEVHKVSIISRGMALGFTLSLPKEDNKLIPKSQFEHELARLLGGRAAEELIFKEVTTGASNDLERATEIARNMVMVYGMSELGPVKLGEREEMVFLGREMGMHRVHSEKVAAKIDEEISRLIDNGWKTAVALLKKEIKVLHHMAHELLEKETLEDEDLRSVFATLKVAKHAA
ncbi:MAG: AAA family ATPase [Candidatus Berkelbacteria bacterium]|nr:AAA family ATPase [Candidatus Berkelbacteria bacterium]MCR4307269.1 AAA family ATPase [Candidatus Berkelbacteria bacterium]